MAHPFVQQVAEQSPSSVASYTTSGALVVTQGNAIVICMSSNGTGAGTLVATDSQGNVYTPVVTRAATSGVVAIAIAVGVKGGSTTFTVTPNASQVLGICAQEYAGVSTAVSVVDGTNSATNTGTLVGSVPVSPSSRNDLYVACWTHDGSVNQTFGFNASLEGWTARSNLTNTALMPLGSQDLISGGPRTGSATLSVSATHMFTVAAFRMLPLTYTRVPGRPFPYRPGSQPSRNPPYR